MPYLTHVKEFLLSPWIQENRDLQNGRIPLVLESVSTVRKRLHNKWSTGLSGPRTGELRGKGLERWKPHLFFFFLQLNMLKHSTCWTSCLITQGHLILLRYLNTLKSHSCIKLRNNIFLMRSHELEKGKQRFGLHLSKVSRISFWGPVSKVRYVLSLCVRVLLLLNYLSFSPSLCTLKERSSTCRTEKKAVDRMCSRD